MSYMTSMTSYFPYITVNAIVLARSVLSCGPWPRGLCLRYCPGEPL